ncbi:agmatinase [bacterium]|nr:agmatinase [bacterium]
MKRHTLQFLDAGPEFSRYDSAAVSILPVPYEGGISFGAGTAAAPGAVLEASVHMELYDEVLRARPCAMGISTLAPVPVSGDPEQIYRDVQSTTADILADGKMPVILGGDHSVSNGSIRACFDRCPTLSVIQFDAHADLRDSYMDSRLSHACTMARVLDYCSSTLQLGIRSLSAAEADLIASRGLSVFFMHQCRQSPADIITAIDGLSDPVYITVDVDAFDGSVVRSTGTPEPGGFLWDEMLFFLREIFLRRTVVGFDLVELSADASDSFSVFAVTRLLYKMLGFRLDSHIRRTGGTWPEAPAGPLFFTGDAP